SLNGLCYHRLTAIHYVLGAKAVQAQETPSTWEPEVKEASESWDYWGQDPTIAHLARFFESVKTRRQPYQDALVGHRAASCAHMINLAQENADRLLGFRQGKHQGLIVRSAPTAAGALRLWNHEQVEVK
ncbi:hypothetical protein MYX75_08500, partial [Acidobacteria bacterium AH-259-A15]|nr:hypothetical protein [Acidobacteria bacterium AH-259-A15]